MKKNTTIKSAFIYSLIICFILITHSYAGMSYTNFLGNSSLKMQIKACSLVVDLKIISIKKTKQIRNSGYRKYDDCGPYIKTKEQKVLVRGNIIHIQKNSSKLKLKKNKVIELTFWKQISGPISRNYREGWQKLPLNQSRIKALFLRTTARPGNLQPTFVHKM